MVLVVVELLVVVALWWAWRRGPRSERARRATAPAALPRPAGAPPAPAAAPTRRTRCPAGQEPQLTEDDVIAFGLALERTADVVRSARTCTSRAPAEQRVQRDAPGAS